MAEGEVKKRISEEIETGLFGLALFANGMWRCLYRETLDQYELDVVVSVNLSDLNENRSFVNDVELMGYDKLYMSFVNI